MSDASFATVLSAAKTRILAMQQAAISGVQAAFYPSFTYPYGSLYITNRVGQIPPPATARRGADAFLYTVPIHMALHTGWATEGYDGVLEETVQLTHIPTLLVYFQRRRNLVYEDDQRPIGYYAQEVFGMTCQGYGTLDTNVEGVPMVGARFVLTIGFEFKLGTVFQ